MKHTNLFFSQWWYFLSEAQLLSNVLLISALQQSVSIIHMYVYIYIVYVCMYLHIILFNLFFVLFCFVFGYTVQHVGFVSWPGTEPASPAVKVWSLNQWSAREVCVYFFHYDLY